MEALHPYHTNHCMSEWTPLHLKSPVQKVNLAPIKLKVFTVSKRNSQNTLSF